MMRRGATLFLALTAALGLSLAGCGSNRDSGGDQTQGTIGSFGTDSNGIAYVGADTCISCHKDMSFSSDIVQEFLGSTHVLNHFSLARGAECLECHDPIGDGVTLEKLVAAENVPAGGMGAVTCETCHGAGGEHFGVGPIPQFKPGVNACGECHNEAMDHEAYHPFGDSIVESYNKSGHAKSINSHVQEAPGEPVRARCSMCHTDEGFQEFSDTFSGLGHDELEADMASLTSLTKVSPIQCRTCHDPHSGELRAEAIKEEVTDTKDEEGAALAEPIETEVTKFSQQFNLCTKCHQVFVEGEFNELTNSFEYRLDPGVYDSVSGDPTALEYHNPNINPYGAAGEIISDTHFAFTDSADAGNDVVGYNINAADENACLNCHDGHGATKFEQPYAAGIAESWGGTEGFHGDYESRAFSYPSYASCASCHSGTEFVKLTEGQTADHLDGGQARVVACVSCHDLQSTDEATGEFELGETRDIEFAFNYYRSQKEEYPETELQVVEGLEGNALCMTCHSGRTSKWDVDKAIAEGTNDKGVFDFVNVHYKVAGATQYGNMAKAGYEFDGKTYASKFEHVATNDSCLECHSAHSGELYITESHGALTCNSCHDDVATVEDLRDIRMIASTADYDGDGDTTEGVYYEIEGLKDLLYVALSRSGVQDLGHHPYYGNITTATQLKAAYNLHFVNEDPGAYAHNAAYSIQLLFDSLEALGEDVSGLVRGDSGHFDSSAEAFRHWDLTFDEEDQAFADGEMETSCGKCHSSEGYRAFLNDGDIAETDFSEDTKGISAGLACDSCHTAGLLMRTAGDVTFPSGVVRNLGEPSNLCMECHQGRSSKSIVDERIAAGKLGFSNIHYYAAAASFFGTEVKGGYEYDGKTYAGRPAFAAHAADGFDTCTGCHMADSNSHDFKPEFTQCSSCHSGTGFEDMGIGVGTTHDNIQALKTQLLGLLKAGGVESLSGYPYFKGISTAAQLKGAYNWQVADKEPAGYIHNGDYIQQLLHDSVIDLGGTPEVTAPGR